MRYRLSTLIVLLCCVFVAEPVWGQEPMTLYGVGRNHWGQLGQGRTSIDPLPEMFLYDNVLKASAGTLFSAFITVDGDLMGTGQNTDGQMGEHVAFDFFADPRLIDTEVVDLSSGAAYIMYIKSDGTLWGIGGNNSGELGNGTTTRTWDPVQVATDVIFVSAGRHGDSSHTLYITSDNTLWGMGSNSTGQLGDGGSILPRTSPIEIADNVVYASSGIGHTVYITTNGDLYAMGWNQFGQLGDGTFETRTEPVMIASGVTKAKAANNQSYYITNDGTLYITGANVPDQGPETENPVILDTNVDDIDPGYSQDGVYLKNDQWLSVKEQAFRLEGYPSISLGAEHTLYLREQSLNLTPIPIRIEKADSETLEITAVPPSLEGSYQLYWSDDLRNWSLHPEPDGTLSGDSLIFEVENPGSSESQFFRVGEPVE